MLKYEGTDKIRDIKYEDGYVDKIYYDNSTQLVFTSDKEKTGVDEVLFKGRKLIDVTSYGKCVQNGTPTPDTPVDIVCNNGVLKFDSVNQEIYADGTVETVEVSFCDNTIDGQGTFVSPNSATTTRIYKTFGQLPNGQYKVSIIGGFEFIFQYKDAIKGYTQYGNIGTWATSGVYDLDQTGYYYGIAIRYPNNRTIQPSDFNGTIAIIPTGNSATAEMLLKIGNYQDTQEVISGVVTRNVGVMVLDGTEEIWGTVSQTHGCVSILTNCYTVAIPLGDAPIDKRRVYCTHLNSSDTLPDASARQGFALLGNGGSGTPEPLTNKYAVGLGLTTRFPTIAGLKQWLAQQYAAGTPVTIIYPLAQAVTEQVAPQVLNVQTGDNILEITQASIDDILLKVKYK